MSSTGNWNSEFSTDYQLRNKISTEESMRRIDQYLGKDVVVEKRTVTTTTTTTTSVAPAAAAAAPAVTTTVTKVAGPTSSTTTTITTTTTTESRGGASGLPTNAPFAAAAQGGNRGAELFQKFSKYEPPKIDLTK